MSTSPTDEIEIRTLVVKIGTTLLSSGSRPFDERVLGAIVNDLARLKQDRAMNLLVVSSGAIGCGMNVMGIKERPKLLRLKQATAAVGQVRLVHCYETLFQATGTGLKVAQVLLSAGDLDKRQTYLNVRNTIHSLFDMGCVVPIVNENDSTAIEELRFGDNDTLAAKIAGKIDADLLIILSNVDGLYDTNPEKKPDAQLLREVENITEDIEALAEDTASETSTGGMMTKVAAAKIACAAGVQTVIANGKRPNVIRDVLERSCPATYFHVPKDPLSHRKRWIAFGRQPQGEVIVDNGAGRALRCGGKSLLAAGIVDVRGSFQAGAAVKVVDESHHALATGLINYSSEEILRIKGCKSDSIESILGRRDFDEVIHRDNMAIL